MRFRRADPGDAEAITALLTECFPGRDPAKNTATVAELADERLVVLVDDDVACCYCLNLVRTIGRWNGLVSNLAVSPRLQGQGVATKIQAAMIEWADQWARDRGVAMLLIGTQNPGYVGAHISAERAGWARVGEAIGDTGQHLLFRWVGR